MGKTLGLALAMTLGLSLTAMAEETRGTIYSMDTSNHTIVLEDGTRLWVTEGQEATVSPGSYVDAAYESKGDTDAAIIDVVRWTRVERPQAPKAEDGLDPLKSIQSGD